jgi:hypothetical protein
MRWWEARQLLPASLYRLQACICQDHSRPAARRNSVQPSSRRPTCELQHVAVHLLHVRLLHSGQGRSACRCSAARQQRRQQVAPRRVACTTPQLQEPERQGPERSRSEVEGEHASPNRQPFCQRAGIPISSPAVPAGLLSVLMIHIAKATPSRCPSPAARHSVTAVHQPRLAKCISKPRQGTALRQKPPPPPPWHAPLAEAAPELDDAADPRLLPAHCGSRPRCGRRWQTAPAVPTNLPTSKAIGPTDVGKLGVDQHRAVRRDHDAACSGCVGVHSAGGV